MIPDDYTGLIFHGLHPPPIVVPILYSTTVLHDEYYTFLRCHLQVWWLFCADFSFKLLYGALGDCLLAYLLFIDKGKIYLTVC